MPGRTISRRRTSTSYAATSDGRGGRGPTSAMLPRRTLSSCGSSSREYLRRKRPERVTRGPLRILNTRAWGSLVVGSVGPREPVLRVEHHRAELEDGELPPLGADPDLPEQH